MIDIRPFSKVMLCAAMIIGVSLVNAHAEGADNLTVDGKTYRLNGIDAPADGFVGAAKASL